MRPLPRFHLSRGTELLALALAGMLCVQAVPVQSIVQSMPQVHHCECTDGFCSRNPDGECTCDHHGSRSTHPADHDAESSDRPVVRECDGESNLALVGRSWVKVLLESTGKRPQPNVRPTHWSTAIDPLAPQRIGDDDFHPPRAEARVRSA